MDPQAKIAVLDLAQAYSQQAGAYLAEGLQRKPTTEEIQQFCSSASSILLGSLYASVRQQQGPEEAKIQLDGALAFTGNIVRLMGIPVAMNFETTIRDTPGGTIADKNMPQKAEPKKEETCTCPLDAEGNCEKCISKISEFYLNISGFWKEMGKAMRKKKDTCPVCDRSQYDRAVSRIVPEILKLGEEILKGAGSAVTADKGQAILQIGQEMMAMMYAASNGVPMPLTDAAWQAEVQKRVEKNGSSR